MAKQTSLFTYTGRLGKLSGFKRKGTHFVRTRPDGIHQTANTKKSASRFGKASSTGAFIRRSLNMVGDGGHVNRITTALIPSAGEDLNSLIGVCFNIVKRTNAYFTQPPVLLGNGDIHIPAQKFPKETYQLEVQLVAVCIQVQSRKLLYRKIISHNIDTSLQFNGLDLSLYLPETGTLIMALSVNSSTEIISVKEYGE